MFEEPSVAHRNPSLSNNSLSVASWHAGGTRARRRASVPAHNDLKRWSPRRTLAFIVITNGSFWAAVAYGVWALKHH